MFPNDTNLESTFTFETGDKPLPEEPPFQILLLGDWSGDGDKPNLTDRKPILIDRDNFEDVLNRLKVTVDLDLQDNAEELLTIRFSEYDDFHPDNLFLNLSVFSELRDVRKRLLNHETFNSAANEVRSWFNSPEADIPTDLDTLSADKPLIETENLLDDILAQKNEPVKRRQNVDNSDLGRLISKLVTPYLINIDENEQTKLVNAVDVATSELMRHILHHPRFQALESAWRGLFFMVKRIETDVDLKIFVYDISKVELADNLKSVNNLSESALYRSLIHEPIEKFGGEPFSIVGGNYSFESNVEDIAVLMRIATLAAAANAPILSYFAPQMFGINSFGQDFEFSDFKVSDNDANFKLWTALRSIPEANYLGLSPMRILARLPYGEQTDSTDNFSFEEITSEFTHDNYLWMNPCFAITYLFAVSYRRNGWEMASSMQNEIENLPIHIFQQNGRSKSKPPAEIVLTESIAQLILDQGLMPMISFLDRDNVRIARFQSISTANKKLCGSWDK